jgi:peptidoglycan/LPS O-acetylase OafA/YrhL
MSFWHPTQTVAFYAHGRDNNFNLLRFIAATCVLVSHAFALSAGTALAEPLRDTLHMTIAQIAVDIFFVTSGFLVGKSLAVGGNLRSFVRARCLRIYPALWTSLVLTVVVAGVFFTNRPFAEFFTNTSTYTFLARNSVLVTGIQHTLPGVFEAAPFKSLVNASLWTLPYELAMYFGLALVWWMIGRLSGRTAHYFKWCIGAIAIVALSTYVVTVIGKPINLIRLTAFFFSGAAMYLYRERIPLSGVFVAVVLAALWLSLASVEFFTRLYIVTIPYLAIYLALVPGGVVRRFNKMGDYSYGIYIYAWPVQQALATVYEGISAGSMVVGSFIVTFLLAAVSWHLIEKKALALK